MEFCKEHDDEELWTSLIDYSIDKPYFVHVLLHNIGTHVDPTVLIQKIEDGVKIPGLRDSLVQIMLDYRLQVWVWVVNERNYGQLCMVVTDLFDICNLGIFWDRPDGRLRQINFHRNITLSKSCRNMSVPSFFHRKLREARKRH